MTTPFRHILVFACAVAFDALWVASVHCTQRGWAFRAALSSVAMTTVSLVSLKYALEDWTYFPAYASGFFVGTYGAVWWKTPPRSYLHRDEK